MGGLYRRRALPRSMAMVRTRSRELEPERHLGRGFDGLARKPRPDKIEFNRRRIRGVPISCSRRFDTVSSASQFVSLQSLSFGYPLLSGAPGRLILDGVDLSLPKGSLVALMGGSGSGKTTILRLLGGQIKPQAGSVSVGGRDVPSLGHRELFALRRRMGMLFQFGALFTDMSVFDNVAFPLREHTRLPDDAIRDLTLLKLNAVGLRGAAALMPSEISGGMARRVALARAIALDPELIMYDEPFAGLDPISLGVTANLIRRLNDALGATSIIVTHDVEESLAIVDYVYFLAEGKIVARGTPAEIRASDLPYVRQFVSGEPDGPVRFHYPARDYAVDLGLTSHEGAGAAAAESGKAR